MAEIFTGVIAAGAAGWAGALFNGAPSAISQRCPGCPCGGFIPGAVEETGKTVDGAVCELRFTGIVCGCTAELAGVSGVVVSVEPDAS